jgi:hypothetical protein
LRAFQGRASLFHIDKAQSGHSYSPFGFIVVEAMDFFKSRAPQQIVYNIKSANLRR